MKTDRRRLSHIAVIVGLVPICAVLVLFVLDVPFGKPGEQVYRYSQVALVRTAAALLPLALAVWLGNSARLRRSSDPDMAPGAGGDRAGTAPPRAGRPMVALVGVMLLLAVWTHLAPPAATGQHVFNLSSPSHEGAFLVEALRIESTALYLQQFDELLKRSAEELGGTRLLGNPPGITLLAAAVDGVMAAFPTWTSTVLRIHGSDVDPATYEGRLASRAIGLAWLFTIMWAAASLAMYAWARIWLDRWPAAVLALICLFNPSTALFSPGKDSAQLLTLAICAWGISAGCLRGRVSFGLIGGMSWAVGMCVGLIHAWILLVVGSAVLWAIWPERGQHDGRFLRGCAGFAVGVGVGVAGAYIVWGWNCAATWIAVSHSYVNVLDTLGRLSWHWNLAKFPMFALFVGSGLWMIAASYNSVRGAGRGRDVRPEIDRRFGRALIAATCVALAYTSWQTTLETPRLWMAFVPLLGLGMAIGCDLFRADIKRTRAALLMLVAFHIAATAVQWTLFDARESEARLISGRLYE